MDVEKLYMHAPCGLLVYQQDGLILHINDSLLGLLGFERSEVIQQKYFQDFLSVGAKIHFATHFTPILLVQREIKEISFTFKKKDGSMIPVLLNARLEPLQEENCYLTHVSVSEFMERKRYEREILLAKKQATDALQELSNINAGLKEFAYVASHDLQAPLNTIHAYLEILHEDYGYSLNEEANRCLEIAMQASDRLRTLIRDILHFAQSGGHDVPRAATNFYSLLEQVKFNLSRELVEHNAQLIISDNLPRNLSVSESDMIRLFQNLLSNAMKFVEPDVQPKIEIRGQEMNSHWQFAIQDNGIGIPREQQERIFEAFTRLHGFEQYGGNGIGLASCKKIVQQHGGQIWVASAPGEGSTFYFTISKEA